jgi:aryl-alcohol dehydrogenase-like predicted oxidoreductase
MRYRNLGANGPQVSVVGLGASHFGRICDLQRTQQVVDAALDSGINFIDTAEAYAGSEELLGQVLNTRRQNVVVSSKFGHAWSNPEGGRGTRRVVRASIEGTLRRLQTDYLDLYMMHFPDADTPIDETLQALHELVQEGRVRFVGLSNFAAWEVVEAQFTARPFSQFICVQHPYNLLDRTVERDVVAVCKRYRICLVPAVPLAAGLLTGKYHRGDQPQPGTTLAAKQKRISNKTFDVLEKLECFAHEHAISLLELAIGWLAAQPCIGPVITGATAPEQIRANANACDWQPSSDDLAALDRLTTSTTTL